MDPTSFVQRQHIILGFFQSVTRLMTFTLEELFFLKFKLSSGPTSPPALCTTAGCRHRAAGGCHRRRHPEGEGPSE